MTLLLCVSLWLGVGMLAWPFNTLALYRDLRGTFSMLNEATDCVVAVVCSTAVGLPLGPLGAWLVWVMTDHYEHGVLHQR